MAQVQLNTWLILCIFAGSQRLTDGHPYSRDDVSTNAPHRGPEDANVMLEVSRALQCLCSHQPAPKNSRVVCCSHCILGMPGKHLCGMLWGRLDIQANGTIQLRDEELASLRSARWFMQILEREVPKTPMEIEQQLRYYSQTDSSLPLTEFDRLLFTSVYCAYQIRSVQGLDKNLWIRFFSQLADEIFRDLCKGLCPANSTLLLASWPSKEKPSHLASLKHFYRSNLARTKRDT
ncbi:protein FAM180B isoform X1 [Centrocercus urophasianus]|uniref:protein FAM180B isoform X1 n=1 Tax=Centrocercus urophasianus TaxID=9002 RepID=UPI001C6537F1|nr:protein FAM180B isoform X1 [Centrocercus urophasianus]